MKREKNNTPNIAREPIIVKTESSKVVEVVDRVTNINRRIILLKKIN
jgi:hypothetical protein